MSRNHHRGRRAIGHPSVEGTFCLLAARAEAPALLLLQRLLSAAAASSAPGGVARRPRASSCSLRSRPRPAPARAPSARACALSAAPRGGVGAVRALAASSRTRRASSRSGASTGSRRGLTVEDRDELLRVAPARRARCASSRLAGPERRVVVVEVAAQALEVDRRLLGAAGEPVGLEQLVALRRDPAVAALLAVDVGGPPRRHRLEDPLPAADHEVGVVVELDPRVGAGALDHAAPVVGEAARRAAGALARPLAAAGRARERSSVDGPAQADELVRQRRGSRPRSRPRSSKTTTRATTPAAAVAARVLAVAVEAKTCGVSG